MYIKELCLKHFRGAKELEFDDLDRNLNVFYGVNGAGKTTVLDAVTLLLSWLANRIKNQLSPGRHMTQNDIQNGKSNATLSVLCNFMNCDYSWLFTRLRIGNLIKRISKFSELNDLVKLIQSSITESNGAASLPVLAYYPVNRAVLDVPLRIRTRHQFDSLSTYENSLAGGANFRTFFEWFRDREDYENEQIREIRSSVDIQLNAVRKALHKFMPDFTDFSVKRNPLRMEVKKDGKKLIIQQLSDGEKCLMALVGDLARRLAIANPSSDKEEPLSGEGIVMIDEIDLHLHPKWQRMVVPQLLEVFPNCQFLITTHSPHVINHVQPQSIYMLNLDENGEMTVEHPNESYGKNVDRVLEDLMGLETTRPDEVEDALRQIASKIQQGELEAAKNMINATRKKIGEDPDLVSSSVLIKRKELIGK